MSVTPATSPYHNAAYGPHSAREYPGPGAASGPSSSYRPPAAAPANSSPTSYSPTVAPPPHGHDMLTLPPPSPATSSHHMAQDPYRPPQGHYDSMYAPNPMQGYPPPGLHGQGQHQQGGPVGFAQPAPRQRTAIACRYCRRRKIRCHGFDLSADGRCTNCARFHQECIFTPVSSQAHAFVPAHTAYPHLRTAGRPGVAEGRPMYAQGPPVYGAHGQPLGPVGGHDGYAQQQPPPSQQQQQQHHAPPPLPQSYPPPSGYPHYEDRSQHHSPQDVRHRPSPLQNLHSPDQSRGQPARRGSNAAYEYPDPASMAPVSPATAGSGYGVPGPYPPSGHQGGPYYSQPPRRPSPPPSTGYSYESRSSTSPHHPPYGLHPPQALPPSYDSTRTPPPRGETNGTTNGSRPSGMSVRDMLGPNDNSGGRSSADSDMLKALNRRVM